MKPKAAITKRGARGPRVGLLGGSFNPAHMGHRHISILALRRLQLDQIWWLVSPQNPLKAVKEMAPYTERLASARKVSGDRRIHACEAEAQMETRYTIDTLRSLKVHHPHHRFVWIMGANNLIQITKWRHWIEIF